MFPLHVHNSNTNFQKASQVVSPPLAYNITHDNNLVGMAFGPGLRNPPAFSLGIDIMKVRIPGRESLNSFINTVGDQVKTHDKLPMICLTSCS